MSRQALRAVPAVGRGRLRRLRDPAAQSSRPAMRASYSASPTGWIILGMNPPAEQLIRDYLNRLSVAARGKLGFSQRQSLLDRTRARIEAECGGINGASALQVRKALAELGDPIVLVEREADQAGSSTGTADMRYETSIAGNGNREMAAEQAHANNVAKGSEIGEDLFVTGGPNGSKPGRGSGSIRSVLAGLAGAQRRRRRASAASGPVPRATPRGPGGGSGGSRGDPSVGSDGSGARPGGAPGGEPRKAGLVPSPRRPAVSEQIGSRDLLAAQRSQGASSSRGSGPDQGRNASASATRQPNRRAGSTSARGWLPGRFIRGAAAAARDHTLGVLAIVLLGVGGAAYPPIWLVGAALVLPSKKWDIRDKFFGITLPAFLLIIGTVLIIVLGGEQASISAYAYEAWLGAGRLSRVLAVAGAFYLAWRLPRGRRQPKQPPWNVPHRFG